jgi:hypothetical protein
MNPNDIDLESLYTYSINNKLKVIQGWISSYIGAILMNMGDGHQSSLKHKPGFKRPLMKTRQTAHDSFWEETTPFMRNGSNETVIMSMP